MRSADHVISKPTGIKPVIYLLLFSSWGWLADSGAASAKFVIYGAIIWLALRRIVAIRPGSGGSLVMLIPAVALILLVYIPGYIHHRSEWGIVFKILCAYLVLVAYGLPEIRSGLVQSINLIAVLSVIGWIFAQLHLGFPLPSLLAENERFVYYLTPVGTVFLPGQEHRAQAIFWEPGVLAFYANFVLLASLGVQRPPNLIKVKVALIIAISGSIGGFACAILIFMVQAAHVHVNARRILEVLVAAVTILTLAAGLDFFLDIGEIVNKFSIALFKRDMATDESFSARLADLTVPFVCALDEPWLGFSDNEYYIYVSQLYFGASAKIITNSFGYIAYYYGLFALACYGCLLLVSVWVFTSRLGVAPFVALVMAMCTEPVQFSMLVLVLIIGAWSPDGKPVLPHKHRLLP